MRKKLSQAIARSTFTDATDIVLVDTQIPGFEFRVRRSGTKIWTYRYRNPEGRQRRYITGRFPGVSATAARRLALTLAVEVANGSFASRLVQSGIDLNTVRELLGHADITMVLRYAHMSPGRLAMAVERVVRAAEPAPDSTTPQPPGIRRGRRLTHASMIDGVILASAPMTWQGRPHWHILLYMPS